MKPSLQEVMTWAKHLWDKITDHCLAKALRAGYLGKRAHLRTALLLECEMKAKGPTGNGATEIQASTLDLVCHDTVPVDSTVFKCRFLYMNKYTYEKTAHENKHYCFLEQKLM